MSKQDEKLDQVLRLWDQQAQTGQSAERLQSLQERIALAWSKEADASQQARRPDAPTGDVGAAMFRVCVVAAAGLLFAIGLWWQPWQTGSKENLGTAEFAQIAQHQLAEKAKLLTEMDRVFDGQVSWIAESNGQIQVEIAESLSSDAPAMNDQPLAFRVVVTRREKGQSSWRQHWAVDVVSRGQRVVRLGQETEDDVHVALWAYVLPDGMIAVDSDISAPGHLQLKAKSNGVQQAGRPCQVAARLVGEAEYRMFQTVHLLTGTLSEEATSNNDEA